MQGQWLSSSVSLFQITWRKNTKTHDISQLLATQMFSTQNTKNKITVTLRGSIFRPTFTSQWSETINAKYFMWHTDNFANPPYWIGSSFDEHWTGLGYDLCMIWTENAVTLYANCVDIWRYFFHCRLFYSWGCFSLFLVQRLLAQERLRWQS